MKGSMKLGHCGGGTHLVSFSPHTIAILSNNIWSLHHLTFTAQMCAHRHQRAWNYSTHFTKFNAFQSQIWAHEPTSDRSVRESRKLPVCFQLNMQEEKQDWNQRSEFLELLTPQASSLKIKYHSLSMELNSLERMWILISWCSKSHERIQSGNLFRFQSSCSC